MDEKYETVKLCYTIHKYSSYSANYIPENIMVNNPYDQLSRWFIDSNSPSHFIMLKLKTPCIVESISFGKYIKAHVSDLKRFQIFGGIDDNSLSLLLSAGLRKDSVPETFRLRHKTVEGLYLPVQYIKIVPLQSWGPAFTIWYVELQGKNQEELINYAMETFHLRREEDAVRLMLKHFRRRRYKAAYEALSRESGVRLEGPLQARLWDALVEEGDYEEAEKIFDEGVKNGELDHFISWEPFMIQWQQLCACSPEVEEKLCGGDSPPPSPARENDLFCIDRDPPPDTSGQSSNHGATVDGMSTALVEVSANGAEADEPKGASCARPGPRGGHQLFVDSTTGTLYLFGGWNGTKDMDDLWSFCTHTERWTLLCPNSGKEDGPSPRSCHKCVFDPVNRRFYTLGRYLDSFHRHPSNMNSDLYMYDVVECKWSLLCSDTASAGGPRLVFDHQMCIDSDKQTIYVFGGRILPVHSDEIMSPQYSGLYAYHIQTNTWKLLLPDNHQMNAPLPRVSHSMLFHPVQRRLYIFAGQRHKEQLIDLWWWNVDTGTCEAICRGPSLPPPPAGFTQRATLDPDTDEIFVLSGKSKDTDKQVHNTMWAFSLRRLTWLLVYRSDIYDRDDPNEPPEPRPRFAHQLVYDPVNKVHYLFGGNPGMMSSPRVRLDDLWSLRLMRGNLPEVVHQCRLALRTERFRSLAARARADPAAASRALHYLRHDLHQAFDHSVPVQSARFRQLATELFANEEELSMEVRPLNPRRVRLLAQRYCTRPDPGDLAYALAQVLGARLGVPQWPEPYEDRTEDEVYRTSEVETDVEKSVDSSETEMWKERARRIRLYDCLSRYYRPSRVPPLLDINKIIML